MLVSCDSTRAAIFTQDRIDRIQGRTRRKKEEEEGEEEGGGEEAEVVEVEVLVVVEEGEDRKRDLLID